MHFSLFHATGTLPTTFENFGQFMFTHITQWSSELQSTEYSDSYVFALCCDIIMQHEPMKCALFKLIL